MDKEQLLNKIKKHLERQRQEWKHLIYGLGDLYQSFEEIGIKGQRNTKQRIEEYGLKKYLKSEYTVLDIGCNVGFVDLQISQSVRNIEGVEINPYLIDIGNEVKKFLEIDNVTFYPEGFEKFSTEKKYDSIFSFAADDVADGLSKLSFEQYIDKIILMLNEGGYLFFESQASDVMNNTWDKKYEILKNKFEIIEEKKVFSDYPTNARERVFLILKKRIRESKPNFILITLDGMRRDRIDLCPTVNKISKENIFFPNMMTAAPYTIASMHAMLSGLLPSRNGVNSYFNMFRFKKDKCKTLAQYMKDAGYYTSANIYNKSIIPHQGYENINIYDEKVIDINASGLRMLREAASKEKFFLHLQPAHIHRNTVKNIAKVYHDFDDNYFNRKEENVRMYNSFLPEIDEYVKLIFEELNKLGLRKNTIVIINSDHGTSNGERRGEAMYGCYLYNYSLNSFCILCLPNGKQIIVGTRISSVDVLPTFLDLAGINIDESYEKLDGVSIIPMIDGEETEDRVIFSETGRINKEELSKSEHNVFAVIKDNWKLIYYKDDSKYELFNLENDKDEENDLSQSETEKVLELKEILLGKFVGFY
ncbi:MAG: sulfatase-like hydrolase/transferase [Nanoarchaeota archaeon]|nr:sulfatase-like hydrolase/transferase [Nanoarchaeota archaeon]MBU1051170.1 sulfatase-like hydrolase/transferase [Nanoarchaeota archaeon]